MAQSTPAAIGVEQVWEQQTGSPIFGGAWLDGDRLFTGDADGKLRAFNKLTGKLEWMRDVGTAIASGIEVDDKRVYIQTRAGIVHAVNKNDGEPLWSYATAGESKWDYWDYYLSTPTVDDRQIYFGSGDQHVYALDKRTGMMRWKVDTGGIIHGKPQLSGEKVIVGGFQGILYAIDRGTGKVLWKFKTVGNSYFRNGEIPGTVTVGDGLVYFGGRDYNIYAVIEGTGTGAWNERTPSWIVGQPLLIGDELIVVNSDGANVLSYNAKTGKLNWKTKTRYNMFSGAKALGVAHVAVAGLDGRITILSREDGSEVGFYETGAAKKSAGKFFTEEGKVDYTGVAALEDLQNLYDRQLEQLGGIPGNLAIEDDRLFYATANGEVAAVHISGVELEAEN